MTEHIIAIVGRANVGKSTLFNRLVGKKVAITTDLPGTSRDRVFASLSWHERRITLVDCGGWQAKPQSVIDQMVKQQIEVAIAKADAIIFLVDAKDRVTATDEEIAEMLHKTSKPVILAVNKVDSARQSNNVVDFYRLGLGMPLAISAYHNYGINELMNTLLTLLPPLPVSTAKVAEIKLAIVGRPNVGKSTLLNALLGEHRAIVDDAPGTTRDMLDTTIHWKGKRILLIDTAGIKRRSRISIDIDYYSLLRALQAINRCDVALLLIDAGEFITAQDLHIARYIIESGKGMMLIINKWDLIPQEEREQFKQLLPQRIKFIHYVPILYLSAKLKQEIGKIFPQAYQVWQERQKRLPQSLVDTVVKQAVAGYPPPRIGTKQLQIIKACQDESKLATFILEVNDPKLVRISYKRYLGNKLRSQFNFYGVPLQLIFTKTESRKAVKV